MMRAAVAAFLLFLSACAPPSVEKQLEDKIAGATECIELELLLDDVLAANESGDLTRTISLELAEFIMFRAFTLADDMRAKGFISTTAVTRCEELAGSLTQALIAP